MSWTYPTQEEAQDAYNDSRRKYNSAAQNLAVSRNNQSNYETQRSSNLLQIAGNQMEKWNLEKRVSQLENIIKMLEGNGGFFGTNVPSDIQKSNVASENVDKSFESSIKCDEIPAASLNKVFSSKSVTVHTHSNAALEGFKKEKQRVEQVIATLKNSIIILTNEISSLNSKIASCGLEQIKLKANMASYAYEMNHYKWYM